MGELCMHLRVEREEEENICKMLLQSFCFSMHKLKAGVMKDRYPRYLGAGLAIMLL